MSDRDFRPRARLQTGFTAGELSPAMYGRIDHEKYLLGLKRCENFLVRTHGGISNRAGLRHLGLAYKNQRSRLVPFQFNNQQAYLLEFGDQIMRVWKDGALVLDSSWTCPANQCGALVSNYQAYIAFDAAPAAGDPPHLIVGDELYFENLDNISFPSVAAQLDGQILRVWAATLDGTGFNLVSDYGYVAEAMENAPTVADLYISKVYHLATPYLWADLPLLKFCQSADTITLTHPNYKPRKLVRTDHDAWTLTEIEFAPTVQPPTNLSGSCFSKDGFNTKARYRVTAVDSVTFEESTPAECSFKSNKSIGLPSLNVYTELSAQPHPIIENRLRWTRDTDTRVLRYNVYRSLAHSAFTYVGSAAGDEDPTFDDATLIIDTIVDTSHTTKRIRVKTVGDHGLATGDAVYITGILSADTSGDTLADVLNGNTFKIKKVDNNEFTLRVLDANDYIEYPSGAANYARISVTSWSAADPSLVVIPVADNTSGMDVGTLLHVDGATGADASLVNDKFFSVETIDTTSSTTTITLTLADTAGTVLDLTGKTVTGGKMSTAFGNETDAATHFTDRIPHTETAMGILDPPPPMSPLDPFDASGDYPECCGYHEQRLWFGGTTNSPNSLWATQIALYDNMNRKSPVAATDAVIITLPSTRVNPVYHVLSMRDLLVFTGDGDWWLDSTEGAINAATARAQQQSYIPCSRYVAPVPVTHRVLYAEDRGKGVRELGYVDKSRGLQSLDRTVYARHLFDGKVLNSMSYQSLPFAVLWTTNEDGELLAMSYEPDQEVYAWSRHLRDGVEFVQAVVLSEGDDDNLYLLQRREVTTHPFASELYLLEVMHNRQFDTLDGARFADSYSVTTIAEEAGV